MKNKIIGTSTRPRLTVSKSNSHIYAQIIDDTKGVTLVAHSDIKDERTGKTTKVQSAGAVGEAIAKKAIAKKIKKVFFDRSGFKYHGRVKALADGARKGGLVF
jgi:large subunit ribosomal protein L18